MTYQKKLAICLSGYAALMIAFAFYWGWSGYMHFGGNDFLWCILFTVVLAYIFLITLYFTIDKANIPLIFILPLFLVVINLIVEYFIVFLFNLPGNPAQIDVIYTLTYLVLLPALVTFVWRIKKTAAAS